SSDLPGDLNYGGRLFGLSVDAARGAPRRRLRAYLADAATVLHRLPGAVAEVAGLHRRAGRAGHFARPISEVLLPEHGRLVRGVAAVRPATQSRLREWAEPRRGGDRHGDDVVLLRLQPARRQVLRLVADGDVHP